MKNKDIAEMLQISPATVSLALNNREGVSEETRRKVLELKNSSVRKELAAGAGRSAKGDIGLLIYKKHGNIISETPFFVTLTERLDQQAGKHLYGVYISYYNSSKDIHSYLRSLENSNILGVMVLATEMNQAEVTLLKRELDMPFVLIDAYFPGEKTDSILMDNYSGMMQILKYAAEKGHERIGFVGSTIPTNNFTERFDYFRIGLEKYHLSYHEEFVFWVPPTIDGACKAMAEQLRMGKKLPTLLVAANDILVFGVLNALKQSQVRVPEDVSLIGFGDMPTSQYLDPALTTVKLNNEMIGTLAVNRLVEMIEKPYTRKYTVHSMVEVDLVERESVKRMR